MSEAEKTTTMLPLDAERKIRFTDRGRKFTLVLRRLTSKDWLRYFSGAQFETEKDGNDTIDRSDINGARIQLVDDALIGAEGYPTRTGEPLTSLANWKAAVPVGHKLAAARALEDVAVDHRNLPTCFDPNVKEVTITAVWSADQGENMVGFSDLKHFFTPPSIAHQKKFYRATSQSRVIGGSRRGKTVWSGNRHALIELYDELIQAVDGYSVHGAALTDVEQIRQEMDAGHKVVAASELFAVPEIGDDDQAA